jgi:hypothetical protein
MDIFSAAVAEIFLPDQDTVPDDQKAVDVAVFAGSDGFADLLEGLGPQAL